MRTIVYDCEFLEDGRTIDLISMGMVDDSGREFYAVNREAPWKRIAKHPWLPDNVVPHLPRLHGDERLHRWCLSRYGRRHNPCMLDFAHPHMMSRQRIAQRVADFVLLDGPKVELWADYAAYDHVALAQLFGTMMDLPAGVPMFTHELMQLWERAGRPEKPKQSDEHNALADARHGMAIWRLCMERV
jgi:hypothetical protein